MPIDFSDNSKPFYSPEAIVALCSEFKVKRELQKELQDRLEGAAKAWSWNDRRKDGEDQTPAKVKSELLNVSKVSQRLLTSLDQLGAVSTHELQRRYKSPNPLVSIGILNGENKSNGHVLAIPNNDGSQGAITLQYEDVYTIIEALVGISANAADVRSGIKGVKRDEALRIWMINIEAIWTEVLNRKFSRDVTADGSPISEAACFCVASFQYISPETPQSRVLNEMKLCIQRTRKKGTGRITP